MTDKPSYNGLTAREYHKLHRELRTKERFGVELTDDDTEDMIRQVKNRKGFYLFSKNKRITAWLVNWKSQGILVMVYYDRRIQTIASVMSRKYIERDIEILGAAIRAESMKQANPVDMSESKTFNED